MNILINSSVWIDYFRKGNNSEFLDSFIDENILCTNNLILSEILPPLIRKNHLSLISILKDVNQIPLNIDWEKIIEYQTICLSNGINKVGIPDLIILDNVIQNDLVLCTFDKHFGLIQEHVKFNSFLP